jgi:Tfp pilus assembly protein PilF
MAATTARPELPSGPAPELRSVRPPELPRPTGTVKPAVDHWAQALYYQKDGDFENALKHYTALLEEEPMNPQVRNNLGMLYQERGMPDEAAREFQRAINIDPGYARAHNNLGVALLAQQNTDGAAAAFRAALDLDRRNVDALVNLAIADERLGQRERAKAGLLQALTIDPRSALAHYNLGVLYDETGEAALAIQHYRSFLDHASVAYARRAADVRLRLNTLSRAR